MIGFTSFGTPRWSWYPLRAFRTYVGRFLKSTFGYRFSHTLIARPQMPQQDLRALMPALANKTYFNNPALPKQLTEIDWDAMVLSERQDWL